MKKLLALAALASAVAACQPSTPATQVAATLPVAPTAPAKLPPAAEPPAPVALPDSLTPAMRAALRQVDISSLLLAPQNPQATGYQTVLDGFFGQQPQRLSMAITQAGRDSLRPELLHVAGKTHYRRQVVSFTGDVCLVRLADFYDQQLLLSQGGDEFVQDTASADGHVTNAKAYSAIANFRFVGAAPNTYVLTGQALLDFWIMDDGTVGAMHSPMDGVVLDQAAAKGSGLVLQGIWQPATSQPGQPFLVARDIFLLSPGLITDFAIGSRGSEVNPKYARYGWNTYWENNEWWADAPKPSLNL